MQSSNRFTGSIHDHLNLSARSLLKVTVKMIAQITIRHYLCYMIHIVCVHVINRRDLITADLKCIFQFQDF